jgi:hypothetical protein
MRSFMSYVLGGILVVLALDMIAPPAGLGLAFVPWPSVNKNKDVQIVDRTHKGDRLQVPTVNGRQTVPPGTPPIPIGCEAVFSSLSAGARVNFPGRCLAERMRSSFARG